MNCSELLMIPLKGKHEDPNEIVRIIRHFVGSIENISFGVIVNLINNHELLVKLTNSKFTFLKIEFTFYHNYIDVTKKFVFGNVLIYIPLLGLYQLFDNIEKYKIYLERIQEMKINDMLFRQLVLISAEHKFILRCENKPELIDKIKHALDVNVVSVDEKPTYVQLTFNTINVSSFVQEQNLFERITQSVLNNSIYIPRHSNDNKFVEHDINHATANIVNMLKNIEKHIMQVGKQNMSINNVGGDVNITINQ